MNPHTPPPDDGQDPAEGPVGPSRPVSAGQSASPSTGPAGPPTPPPPYAGTVPLPPAIPPQNFFGWVRSQGTYRGRERWVGGVASGVARRLGVDPLIVRGVLIVLTVFAGIGVLLYGLAWALLPEPDGRIHLQEAGAGRWTAGMTGALAATVIGLPGLGGGTWGWEGHGFGAFVWTVLWLAGLGYLVYYLIRRNQAQTRTAPVTAPVGPGGTVDLARAAAPATATGAGSTHPAAFSSTSPGQDREPGTPVPAPPGNYGPAGGYNPAGGYGPMPGAAPAPARPRNFGPGTPAAAITVGLALLAGGGIKALDAAQVVDLGNGGNAVVWAAGAAVLGLGILFAGLRGRTSGILGFFAVVALLMGAIFNMLPDTDRFRTQNAGWIPSSLEQARSGFEIAGGTGTVDLTRLALNPPLDADVVVPIDAMASNLTVVIPDTVPVHLEANMIMGNLNGAGGPGGNHSGMSSQRTDYNAGKPGARLVLKVSGAMSNVTIQEGN